MAVTYVMRLDDFNSYMSFENTALAERWIVADNAAALQLEWRCLDEEQTSNFYNRDWEHYNDAGLEQCTTLSNADVEQYEQQTAALKGEALEGYVQAFAEKYGFADYDYILGDEDE